MRPLALVIAPKPAQTILNASRELIDINANIMRHSAGRPWQQQFSPHVYVHVSQRRQMRKRFNAAKDMHIKVMSRTIPLAAKVINGGCHVAGPGQPTHHVGSPAILFVTKSVMKNCIIHVMQVLYRP